METMDASLVERALNYHGEQLLMIWESRRDQKELALLNLKDPNFEIYRNREETPGNNDKTLKLHQFIAKKADILYDKSNLEATVESSKQVDCKVHATMPGLDSFIKLEKSQRVRNLLETLVVGDVIYAQVMGKSAAGLLLKILCNCNDCPRIVPDLGIKVLILNSATVPAVDKKGVTREYMVNDLVCVCVNQVNIEAERVIAVMNASPREGLPPHPPLGLIHSDDLPDVYKIMVNEKGQSFESFIQNNNAFSNPDNIKYLCDLLSLGQDNYSNMIGLREKFPPSEYSVKLRQAQASKWALRSVTEGIEYFKAGNHAEAFQCLNKALVIDPLNDEGLVTRGCLYANSGSLKKAIDDFEMVLKLNQTHAGARKYLSETLVALGQCYEEEKNFDEAEAIYEKCLVIVPNHETARNALEFLRIRMIGDDTQISPNTSQLTEIKDSSPHDKESKRKHKKERKSRSRRKQRWSSTSSSSSSASSESNSSSSSNSFRSASKSPQKKKVTSGRESVSPLSKRMALYNNPPEVSNDLPDWTLASAESNNEDDYEMQVRKFLDQSKDDSDYEGKVRIFFEAAAKWKKEKEKEKRHFEGEKSRKKKKKEKRAKSKEERKRLKRKQKLEHKRHKTSKKMERDIESMEKSSFQDLEQLESKLSAFHAKVQRKQMSNIFEEESKYYPEPKMSPNTSNTKLKASQVEKQKDADLQNWHKFSVLSNVEDEMGKKQPATIDKSLNVRKQMHRELIEKREVMKASQKTPLPEKPSVAQYSHERSSLQLQDRDQSLANFTNTQAKSNDNNSSLASPNRRSARTVSRSPESDLDSEEERGILLRKRESEGKSSLRKTSRERSLRRSRNRSSSVSSRSDSPRRSRSYSVKLRRSKSFDRKYSRSFSRSLSRSPSRSYSRSRSRSGERRYHGKRPYNNRGGYRNPRYQNHNQNYRGVRILQGGNRFYNNRQNNRYINGRGFQHRYNNYNSYRGRSGSNRGGRFFYNNRQGFRDYRDNRRDYRDRHSEERHSDRSFSLDPMRKVDEAKKKIDRMLENGDDSSHQRIERSSSDKRQEGGPASENEG